MFDQDGMNESRLLWEADKPLSERLKIPRNQHFDAIPVQLLRKVGIVTDSVCYGKLINHSVRD